MKFPIALQLYTVRDSMEKDFEGTLKKVKEMGYDGVEFAGLYGKSAAEVKALCQEIGLVPISAHIPWVEMVANPDGLKVYAEIGCKYVAIPYLEDDYRPGASKWDEVIKGAKMLGEKAKELDLKLCYHNHDFEFWKINGEYALDIIYREVPETILQTEFDTCWVKVSGVDPCEYIRKYAGRCEIVHLKDYVGGHSENMYELIGIESDGKKADENKFAFRSVGAGLQNFPEILKACEESGTKWVVVEQDEPTAGLSRMECAEKSINYLKTL